MSDNTTKTPDTETEEVFAKFDKISDDFSKTTVRESAPAAEEAEPELTPLQQRRKTRMQALEESKVQTGVAAFEVKAKDFLNSSADRISAARAALLEKKKAWNVKRAEKKAASDSGEDMGKKRKRKAKKKYRLNGWKILRLFIALALIMAIAVGAYVYSIVSKAPNINPDNIYDLLSENSTLYDDEGMIIDNVFNTGEGLRSTLSYSEIPENLVNAFVASEDKTFWTHHGFNIVRIIGAIRDAIFKHQEISGTSTITQQLARNLYLAEIKSQRSMARKITEAYYSVLLERSLTKEQIIEAYLNTIYLGYNTYGVGAAAQAYFSKDVQDLTVLECAALASLPKAPDAYALVKRLYAEDVSFDNENLITVSGSFAYVYNGAASEARRLYVLKNMSELTKRASDDTMITEAQYQAALEQNLKDSVVPSSDVTTEVSSYFADYVISHVIADLQAAQGVDYNTAKRLVYSGGLNIYTTLSTEAQQIVEREFTDSSNFPQVGKLKKDKNDNILSEKGKVVLYAKSSFFDENGNFTLYTDEFEHMPGGGLKLLGGKRLNFFKTTNNGEVEYSVEFKDMYEVIDDVFYANDGGYITIPKQYKDRTEDGDLIISAEFFATDMGKNFFKQDADGNLVLDSTHYTVKQDVIQPQAAMVIMDYHTGAIKAMVGGRSTTGRLLYNRATTPHQPGSSIKPLAIYGPAIQSGYEAAAGGTTQAFGTVDLDGNPVANLYGDYLTAASIVDDAPIIESEGQEPWPKNFYRAYKGLYTLRTAMQQSVNVCAVRIYNLLGPDYCSSFVKKMGISTFVSEGYINDMNPSALALGGMTKGISPLESAAAYGTFPNEGVYTSPISYTKVTNRKNEVLLQNEPLHTEVFNSGVAFIMTDMLQSNVTEGIAKNARISGTKTGGKTGTTNEQYDIWFAGFTPAYSASLWIGNDDQIELSQGSTVAAKLWSKIMGQVVEADGVAGGSFPDKPSNVISETIDTKSGKLPSDLSSLDSRSTLRGEYFIAGTQPTTYDDVHVYVTVCSETGYLATPYCTHKGSAFGVRRPYTPDPLVADITYEVPHYYCPLHNPEVPEGTDLSTLDPSTMLYPVDPNYNGEMYYWDGMQITKPVEDEDLVDMNGDGIPDSEQVDIPDVVVFDPLNPEGLPIPDEDEDSSESGGGE